MTLEVWREDSSVDSEVKEVDEKVVTAELERENVSVRAVMRAEVAADAVVNGTLDVVVRIAVVGTVD